MVLWWKNQSGKSSEPVPLQGRYQQTYICQTGTPAHWLAQNQRTASDFTFFWPSPAAAWLLTIYSHKNIEKLNTVWVLRRVYSRSGKHTSYALCRKTSGESPICFSADFLAFSAGENSEIPLNTGFFPITAEQQQRCSRAAALPCQLFSPPLLRLEKVMSSRGGGCFKIPNISWPAPSFGLTFVLVCKSCTHFCIVPLKNPICLRKTIDTELCTYKKYQLYVVHIIVSYTTSSDPGSLQIRSKQCTYLALNTTSSEWMPGIQKHGKHSEDLYWRDSVTRLEWPKSEVVLKVLVRT